MASSKKTGSRHSAQAAQTKREQLRAEQAAAARRTKRNRLIGVIVGILVLAVALTGLVLWQTRDTPDDNTTDSPTSSTSRGDPTSPVDTGSANSSVGASNHIPPHGTEEASYLELKSDTVKADALLIDEYLDYQCPYCSLLTNTYGEALKALVDSGDIVLRVHIRSFLDINLQNDSSTRAAMAATCADDQDAFLAYHDTVFRNQPEEGVGYTDNQLRVDFAGDAGLTGESLTTFQQCYDQRSTLWYVQQMEAVNSTLRTIGGVDQDPPKGTPALYLNGASLSMNALFTVVNNAYAPAVDPTAEGFLGLLKEQLQ